MADYIQREAAVKIAERYGLTHGSVLGRHSGIADCIASEIEMIPAANVVEVARCKECLLRGKQACAMYYRCGCGEQHSWETDDDFCSRGIKMNERAAV